MPWKRIFSPEAMLKKKNQTEALIIRLAELQHKFKFQLQRVPVVKIRALVGTEWNPATWDGDVWEDLTETENFELQVLKGLFHRRK